VIIPVHADCDGKVCPGLLKVALHTFARAWYKACKEERSDMHTVEKILKYRTPPGCLFPKQELPKIILKITVGPICRTDTDDV